VTITAASQADTSRTGNALVTIIANVQVNVSPSSVTVPPGGSQIFTATVVGTPNQTVTWSVSGPPGGCTGAACGTIDSAGLYSAPSTPPSPNTATVTATSVDGGQTGTATVTISTGPSIRTLLPASLTAGAAVPGGFTLKIQGSNFISGATILFNGTAKPTTCTGSTECSATLMAADVATAGNQTVQVQNPGSPPQGSNQVFLVVVPMAATEDVIPLTGASPNAVGKDIVVVEPTTAGSGTQQINIDLIGIFSAGTCSARNFPVTVARASSPVDICITGTDLDTSHTYTISGPTPNDITISNVRAASGGVALTLTLSSTTQAGLRTLFVENPNKEKSAASGAIEVK